MEAFAGQVGGGENQYRPELVCGGRNRGNAEGRPRPGREACRVPGLPCNDKIRPVRSRSEDVSGAFPKEGFEEDVING